MKYTICYTSGQESTFTAEKKQTLKIIAKKMQKGAIEITDNSIINWKFVEAIYLIDD